MFDESKCKANATLSCHSDTNLKVKKVEPSYTEPVVNTDQSQYVLNPNVTRFVPSYSYKDYDMQSVNNDKVAPIAQTITDVKTFNDGDDVNATHNCGIDNVTVFRGECAADQPVSMKPCPLNVTHT